MSTAFESVMASSPGPIPVPAATGARDHDLSVRVVTDAAELSRYSAAWEDLASDTVEANVFYEPWMLLPALDAFRSSEELLFVLVLSGDRRTSPENARLCGFFPLQRRRLNRWLPLSILGLWQHIHCYLCTPLVRADARRATLAAFFDWLTADARGAPLMEFNQVNGAGLFSQTLRECCGERTNPVFVREQFERALFRPRGDGAAYLRAALSRKRLRSFERKQRRLGETAPLEYTMLEPGQDVTCWADEFLRLEAAGWKGEAGTALACDSAHRRFFHAILRNAHQRGRLLLCALRLAGRPVAMRCGFLAGAGSFAFKIAYDETYGPFSPGVLLEMEHVRRLHAIRALEWMDSCAASDNRMLNQLWPDRRPIQTILAATGPGLGRFAVALYPWLRSFKRRLRRGSIENT